MSASGWMSEKQRKQTIREAKEHQERAYAEKVKLDNMSRRDPGYQHQQDRMIRTAQECGVRLANWQKAQGRQGRVLRDGK